jgi:hypothetical protein
MDGSGRSNETIKAIVVRNVPALLESRPGASGLPAAPERFPNDSRRPGWPRRAVDAKLNVLLTG